MWDLYDEIVVPTLLFVPTLFVQWRLQTRCDIPNAKRLPLLLPQDLPDAVMHMLLEGGELRTNNEDAALWVKAKSYYFSSIARLQRLWQVDQPP